MVLTLVTPLGSRLYFVRAVLLSGSQSVLPGQGALAAFMGLQVHNLLWAPTLKVPCHLPGALPCHADDCMMCSLCAAAV